jgi:hypothetical protein
VGRAEYFAVTDAEALEAFQRLSQLEGIIPALETSHALAFLEKLCPTLPDGTRVVLNCRCDAVAGRGRVGQGSGGGGCGARAASWPLGGVLPSHRGQPAGPA